MLMWQEALGPPGGCVEYKRLLVLHYLNFNCQSVDIELAGYISIVSQHLNVERRIPPQTLPCSSLHI